MAAGVKKIDRSGPPKMPQNILLKLFGFTIILFVLPILSFFVSKNMFAKNGEIYAGIIAVVAANLVILLYICMIFNEDEIDSGFKAKKRLDAEEKVSSASSSSEKETIEDNENSKKGGLRRRK